MPTTREEAEKRVGVLHDDVRKAMLERGWIHEGDVAALSATVARTRRRWALKPSRFGNILFYKLDDIVAELESDEARGEAEAVL